MIQCVSQLEKRVTVASSNLWLGHPDTVFDGNRLLVCARESDRHLTTSPTKIQIWQNTGRDKFTHYQTIKSNKTLNCPRLSLVGSDVVLIVDEIDVDESGLIACENQTNKTRVLIRNLKSEQWHDPKIDGILPSRIVFFGGYYYLATHTKHRTKTSASNEESFSSTYKKEQASGNLYQKIWRTKDVFDQWEYVCKIDDASFNLCEASLFVLDSRLVCLMRENSDLGLPAIYCWSCDGQNWSQLNKSRLFGCHRPVAGVLSSGRVLVTYREQMHQMSKIGWARNTFAALLFPQWDGDNLKLDEGVVLPLDHDNSPKPDSGYTGWAECGEKIFVTNYITSEMTTPYITGYLIEEHDFIRESNQ